VFVDVVVSQAEVIGNDLAAGLARYLENSSQWTVRTRMNKTAQSELDITLAVKFVDCRFRLCFT
jgi:hypothetical protein